MLLLGDLGQQLDIRDTQETLDRIKRHLQETSRFDQDVARNLADLARENAELKLYLAAIVRLLVAKGTVTPAELAAVVEAIDRSDGQTDGGLSGKIPPAG